MKVSVNTIRWWMEVMKQSVYAELCVLVIGVCIFGFGFMFKNLPSRGFIVLFGILLAMYGAVLCIVFGITHDKMNVKLHAAENEERKEQRREEKHARKPKAN